jgi:hypothetical protein
MWGKTEAVITERDDYFMCFQVIIHTPRVFLGLNRNDA